MPENHFSYLGVSDYKDIMKASMHLCLVIVLIVLQLGLL